MRMRKSAPNWLLPAICICFPVLYPAYLAHELFERAVAYVAYTKNEVAAARFRHKAKRATKKKSRVSKPLLPQDGGDPATATATSATATATSPGGVAAAATTTTTTTNAIPSTDGARKPTKTSFLDLPWELRTRIYDLALHDGHHDRTRTVGEPLIQQIQGSPRRGPLPAHWLPGQHVRSDADPPSAHLERLVRAGCSDGMRQTILIERGLALLCEHRLLLNSKLPSINTGKDKDKDSKSTGTSHGVQNEYIRTKDRLGFFPTAAMARERRQTVGPSTHYYAAMDLEARAEKEERERREGRGPVRMVDLMCACRAVYADLLGVLYGRDTFSFFGAHVLAFFGAVASPEGLRQMRYVHLAFCVPAVGEGTGKQKGLRVRERKILKQRKGVEGSIALLRDAFRSLKQLDIEIIVDAGGAGQPADPAALWRWLTGEDVLGRLKGLGLDAFVFKVSVLLDLEVKEGKRPPRSVPLSSWDEEGYQALKRAVMTPS